jgi:hypothetical protein
MQRSKVHHTMKLRVATFIGIFLQGPLLAYMADFRWVGYGILSIIAFGLAIWAYKALVEAPSFHKKHWLLMAAYSNLGMWIGWIADFGFLPLLRDGVCLCGCACSPLGIGAAFHCPWMYVGMYLGALPAILLKDPATQKICPKAILGCVAMGPGMLISTWAFSYVPISNPIIHLFLTAIIMLLGMHMGMHIVDKIFALRALRKIPI